MTEEPWKQLAARLGSVLDAPAAQNGHGPRADGAQDDDPRGADDPDQNDPRIVDELRRALSGQDSAGVAMALGELEPEQAARAFDALDERPAVDVLGRVGPDVAKAIGERLPERKFRRLVEQLPQRKAAMAVTEAPRQRAREIVKDVRQTRPAEAEDLEARLHYPPGTAGRLMTQDFVRLRPDMTVRDALDAVRRTDPGADLPNDLYVVESCRQNGAHKDRLQGVVPLRGALMAQPDAPIRLLMNTQVVTIKASASRMDAAKLLATHAFLVLPVLDDEDYLVGVIPVDDLMRDVVSRLEHLHAQAVGTDAEEMEHLSPFAEARKRVPWLLGTMLIEMGSGVVISHFNHVLQQVILLASFLPVLSAVAGNVGLQAAAIVVRALDTGHASLRHAWQSITKEVATTAMMAAVCGVVLGGIGIVWSGHLDFGLVVGGALAVSMLTAAVMGTIIPMVSKRFGFDPATTAGPFETAFQDVIGYAVFLWLAALLLTHL